MGHVMSEQNRQLRINLYIKENLNFSKDWEIEIPSDKYVKAALAQASKQDGGGVGKPDLIYTNRDYKLLILGEVKPTVKQHVAIHDSQRAKYAVDGIKHYLSFFSRDKLEETKKGLSDHFKGWTIIGLAISGDIQNSHQFDSFLLDGDGVNNLEIKEFLHEREYINLRSNVEIEKIASKIDETSRILNEKLRQIDSQKRPVLLSACMICLFPDKAESTEFRNLYASYARASTLFNNMTETIREVLKSEDIPSEKIDTLINELSFCKTDATIQETTTLADILDIVKQDVVPLLQTESTYDVLGSFYHGFLTYAGITNVKNGIVLTPSHICELFADLIDIKTNDVILDPACGTGSFLIVGMNRLIRAIKSSKIKNKKERIKNIKTNQLIGFELNSTLYSLSIANMLFRGDGKSRIHQLDFFSDQALEIINQMQPTIGFVNPPYGGMDNDRRPTKKEIQFLSRMLNSCSRYGIIIAPWSTFIQDAEVRSNILAEHTLLYSINMPPSLFQPNASTHTTICVFKTHQPHGENNVVFYDLKDDGFVLHKVRGRTDMFNRWSSEIKPRLLNQVLHTPENSSPTQPERCFAPLNHEKDEWIIQDHLPVDWSDFSASYLEKAIKEYSVFLARLKSGKISKGLLSDSEWIDIVFDWICSDSIIQSLNRTDQHLIDITNWSEFSLCDTNDDMRLFDIKGTPYRYTKEQIVKIGAGSCLYVTTSNKNNGVSGVCNVAECHNENLITIDSATDGKTFYQQAPFVGSDHVECLYQRPITRLNVFTGLFLVALLDYQMNRYGYGRKRSQSRIKNEKVLLPCKTGNLPDWKSIEDIMKRIPYSANLVE